MQGPEVFAGGMSIVIVLISCVAAIVPIGITGAVLFFMFKKSKERQELVATGVAGQATIVTVGDTGMLINNQPRLSFVLDVQPMPGHPPFAPFRANHDCTVPMMAMARVSPGTVVPVKCDPANPTRLTIDWRAMGFMV